LIDLSINHQPSGVGDKSMYRLLVAEFARIQVEVGRLDSCEFSYWQVISPPPPNPAEPEPKSKLEIRNKFKARMIENRKTRRDFCRFGICDFEFPSDFELRISNFLPVSRRISVVRY
jgi:hypothetical protein